MKDENTDAGRPIKPSLGSYLRESRRSKMNPVLRLGSCLHEPCRSEMNAVRETRTGALEEEYTILKNTIA